jgi:hypothetical protein
MAKVYENFGGSGRFWAAKNKANFEPDEAIFGGNNSSQ